MLVIDSRKFLGSQISTRLVPFDITVVFWFYDANIFYLLLAHALNSLQGYRSFHEMTVTDSCGCHKQLVESLLPATCQKLSQLVQVNCNQWIFGLQQAQGSRI